MTGYVFSCLNIIFAKNQARIANIEIIKYREDSLTVFLQPIFACNDNKTYAGGKINATS